MRDQAEPSELNEGKLKWQEERHCKYPIVIMIMMANIYIAFTICQAFFKCFTYIVSFNIHKCFVR